MEASLHDAEIDRLAALRSYGILDTPREKDFDDIVSVVSAICDAPISVINLIDDGRQWFKAEVGLGVRETPLPASICAHAILQPDLLEVPDTLEDMRFSDNPLVTGAPHLRFYAGALLQTASGLPLGTICVLDYKPRTLDRKQKDLLRLMSRQIMQQFELRRLLVGERQRTLDAEELVRQNELLARESDHRVMNSLQLVSSVLGLQWRSAQDGAKAVIRNAQQRVHAIATVHRQLHVSGSLATISIDTFLRGLCTNLMDNAPQGFTPIEVRTQPRELSPDLASAVGMIVAELVANSFKHAFPNGRAGRVAVDFANTPAGWRLAVSDNGVGVHADFDPARSSGLGMNVIMAMVKRLGASLRAEPASPGVAFVVDQPGGEA